MNPNQRSQTVIVALVAASLIPRIQKWTGVVLTVQDVGDLLLYAVTLWHYAATVFERYFPPPALRAASVPFVQTQPQETKP
jgi:hypothetical protein